MALGPSGVGDAHGGFSAIGYLVLERHWTTGEVSFGPTRWLELSSPFGPCDACDEFSWADLTPAMCRLVVGAPRLSSLLVASCFAAGVAQLVLSLRRLRSHGRLVRGKLLRGLLLIGAALPISNCRSFVAGKAPERCGAHGDAPAARRPMKNSSRGEDPRADEPARFSLGVGAQRMVTVAASNATGAGELLIDGVPWRNSSRRASSEQGGGQQKGYTVEYDGYEDCRAIVHGSTVYLLANHEDCDGRRRLVLLRLEGDAEAGTLGQAAAWELRVDDGPDGPFELQDNEKNWVPFIEGGALHLSYSLQPHVVLRCAWTGGSCHKVHNSTSDFLQTYDTLGQGLRGGTPYARLPNGDLLAALHVKDYAHSPSLYATIFYIISARAPHRVLSVSPKLCLSERSLDLAISPHCALQYVAGLAVEPETGVVLVSYGQMDRQMKVAALPLDRVLAFARTHQIGAGGGQSVSECDPWPVGGV